MKKKYYLSLVLYSVINMVSYSQVSRIEPPNWWAGMKEKRLQLMVYGRDIGGSDVSVDPGEVKITGVTSPENQNYLFIDLELSDRIKPGIISLNFTKAKVTRTVGYEIKKRETGSAERTGFNSSDVIYLLVPDRFANGNPGNDNIKGMPDTMNRKNINGRHGGDLEGISINTGYIEKMGFTALWTTPVLENNQQRASYHGYAITDFYNVDPRLGTNGEYAKLGKKLKENGIKLIMDQVFNHCGNEHWWMNDLPFPDWVNNYPEIKLTNNRHTVIEDPYASEYDKNLFTDGWFVRSMPDLNHKNPFMASYLIQNSIWWIEYAGLAGIRMDTYPYADKQMLADWTKRVTQEYPNFNIVGEEWHENPAIVSYWQKGQNNRDGYVSDLPSLMDFPLQAALVKALTEPEEGGGGWMKLYETLALDFLYPFPGNLVILGDNHDMARFYMQLGKDTSLFKLGMTFLLTTRGIPQVFYGTEILMTHPVSNKHGDIRRDFPGGWENDTVNAFTGEGLRKGQLQAQEFFSILLNWRKQTDVIHSGKLMHFVPEKGCYVYFRYNESGKVMVILNKNNSPVMLPLEKYREMLAGYSAGKDILSGTTFNFTGEVMIPAKTPLVIELR